jgi:hypothetical protein
VELGGSDAAVRPETPAAFALLIFRYAAIGRRKRADVFGRRGAIPRRWPFVMAIAGSIGLAACTTGDFGRVRSSFVSDDMHAWVGAEAARESGIPPSTFATTDDERLLRDLAYPLIAPPHERYYWINIVSAFGETGDVPPDWGAFDITEYERQLMGTAYRSATARYAKLNDDIRSDVERIPQFFTVARRVLDMDQNREKALPHVSALTKDERANARRRIAENALVVAWAQRALVRRTGAYRYALERLVVTTPAPMAVEVERSLVLLKSRIGENRLVADPAFGRAPATRRTPVSK